MKFTQTLVIAAFMSFAGLSTASANTCAGFGCHDEPQPSPPVHCSAFGCPNPPAPPHCAGFGCNDPAENPGTPSNGVFTVSTRAPDTAADSVQIAQNQVLLQAQYQCGSPSVTRVSEWTIYLTHPQGNTYLDWAVVQANFRCQ